MTDCDTFLLFALDLMLFSILIFLIAPWEIFLKIFPENWGQGQKN